MHTSIRNTQVQQHMVLKHIPDPTKVLQNFKLGYGLPDWIFGAAILAHKLSTTPVLCSRTYTLS
uniref:Uncharacterized protein n=1 Tax=Arundo donax TaxID=35708 RepID=A0A0A9BQM2_ARUDO